MCRLYFFLRISDLLSTPLPLFSEPENLELRRFITRLDARINAKAMDAKRQSQYQNANIYALDAE